MKAAEDISPEMLAKLAKACTPGEGENGAEPVRGPENEIFTLLASPEVWEPGLILSDKPLPRASTGRSKARKVKKARKVTKAARRKNRGK